MTYIVYKITGPEGKAYIGITKRTLRARWLSHIEEATKKETTWAFHYAIRKYGAESFLLEVLTECVDSREAKACERALIASHGTFVRTGNGYNMTLGGDGNWGWSPTKETRRKMGEKKSAYLRSHPELLKKMGAGRRGKARPRASEEHRRKIGDAHRGKKLSAETKAKISAAGMGRKWTAEQREKHAAAMTGRKRNPASVAKMAATKRGKKMSPDHAAAARLRLAEIRERRKGIPMSDEQRAKISAKAKARLATPEARAEMVKRLQKGAHKRYLPENRERQRQMMLGNTNTLGRKMPLDEKASRSFMRPINKANAASSKEAARQFDRPLWWKEWL